MYDAMFSSVVCQENSINLRPSSEITNGAWFMVNGQWVIEQEDSNFPH